MILRRWGSILNTLQRHSKLLKLRIEVSIDDSDQRADHVAGIRIVIHSL